MTEKDNKAREVGYAQGSMYSPTSEDNWDLKFPQSARVFSKMAREDTQVKALIRATTLPIRRATWRIDPNGAPDDIVGHVAEDLRLTVLGDDPNRPLAPRSGRVSWEKHLEQALSALQYGVIFFEQVYEVGDDGLEHLVKLAPRRPGTIKKVNLALDGGLVSIEQDPITIDGKQFIPDPIPISRLVAYAFDDSEGDWTGQSILRPAYKNWFYKNELLELENVGIDRNSSGYPVYEGTEHTDDPKRDLEYGQDIVEGARSGRYTGASIPMGSKLSFIGVSGQVLSPRNAIEYHDAQMANAVLAHFLNLNGEGGSYSLAETQQDLFVQSLQTTAEWIADIATQHIIEDLVRVAYPDHDGLMPRIVFEPIGSQRELSPSELGELVRNKVVIMDSRTEEDTRRRYGMTPKMRVSEAIEAKKTRLEMEKEAGVSLSSDKEYEQPAIMGQPNDSEEETK